MKLDKAVLIVDPVDKRLHERVKEVKDFNAPKLYAVITKMKEIQKATGGVGLAANQIGVNMRIITCYHEGLKEIVEFINPRLVNDKHEAFYKAEHITWQTEGCLSHPGILAEIARFDPILFVCHRLNHTGELKIQAAGMIARIIQHEICHLNGRLITDMEQYVRNIIPLAAGQQKLMESQMQVQEDFVAED